MKRLLSIGLFLLICTSVNAENSLNTVFLDMNENSSTLYTPSAPDLKTLNVKEDTDNEDYIYRPLEYVKSEARELYSKQTVSNKKEKKFGKTMVGAKCDTTLAPDSLSQQRTLYSNYNLTDKMTVGADYKTNSTGGMEAQTKGTIGVGPEYQINKKVKLKNKFSKNFGDSSNKEEISVEYIPFQDDRMDFSAGAAQIQQDDGSGSRSQVNFGTNFRF